jgi:hypothetical protein
MIAVTEEETRAKARAERRLVSMSSWPLGGLFPVVFSHTPLTSLVATNPAPMPMPAPSSLKKMFIPELLAGGNRTEPPA